MTKVWFAKECDVLMTASTPTINTATTLYNTFSAMTSIKGVLKDISVTEQTGDTDIINLLGTDSTGYQNAEMEEKPAGLVEVQATMVLPGDEVVEQFVYDTNGSTVTGGYTRYRSGKALRRKVSLCLRLTDGTDEVAYAATNALLSAKDVKVTGADGHFEATMTLKCLPRDFYGPEFKD